MVSKAVHDLVTKKQLFATECLLTGSITLGPNVRTHDFLVFSLVFYSLDVVNHMSLICNVQSILLDFYHFKQLQIISPWSC